MSQYNARAHDPAVVEVTRAWLRRESPVVFIYAPSGVGKTTLIGSLFRHPLYHRVLYIDIDQGSATIAEYTLNEQLCDLHKFDQVPDNRVSWFNGKLKYARAADCGAIVVEGFTSIHSGMVSANMEDVAEPEGPAAMRAHVGPSNRTGALLESFRRLKQYRLAAGQGVPIVVTLNTRETPVSPGDMKDQRKKIVPDWSPNLSDKLMRVGEACIELGRGPQGTTMATLQTTENSVRKLRSCVPFDPKDANLNAAVQVHKQFNLDLPGMFALWAQTDAAMQAKINELLGRTNSE